MLRSLVVLFLGLNILLFAWLRANPTWGETDREPQRLQRQVSPQAIQVLPDLPANAASAPVAAAPITEELAFAPPAAGIAAAPHASTATTGSSVRAASAPVVKSPVATRRPSGGATPPHGPGSR